MIETCDVPCFVCGTYLRSFDSKTNHPLGGVELTTRGHYGCSVVDGHMGVIMAINICDRCLRERVDNILAYDDGIKKPRRWAASAIEARQRQDRADGPDPKGESAASEAGDAPTGEPND